MRIKTDKLYLNIEISSLCKIMPKSELLYQLDEKDMSKVIRLLLEACTNGNM